MGDKTKKFTNSSMSFMWRTHDNFYNDLSNQKFHSSFWLMGFKVGETETDCESGSMLHYMNKNHIENSCFTDFTYNAFWKYMS